MEQKKSLPYSWKPVSGPYPEPSETHTFCGKNFLHVKKKNYNHGDSANLSSYVRQLKLHWNLYCLKLHTEMEIRNRFRETVCYGVQNNQQWKHTLSQINPTEIFTLSFKI
jgi:hypothetical protein